MKKLIFLLILLIPFNIKAYSEAIKKAINTAQKDDIVLIIGKGSESYQTLKDKIIEFNDIEETKKHLNNLLQKNI